MKKLIMILFLSTVFFAQEFERNILIEIFTNSHCPLCPIAHTTLDSYLAGGQNSDRVGYIYYHMSYPYSDDQLNQANPEDASGRNQYYGPFSSTPRAFFDGNIQSGNYRQWDENIDSRLAIKSPVNIELSGSADEEKIDLSVDIDMSSSFAVSGLVIHIIAVEDVEYEGRNGISDHKNVMREMVTGPEGEPISTAANQTVTKSFTLDSGRQSSNLTFIIFVQNSSTMEVYQSEWIDYSELTITGVEDETEPFNYSLDLNYPNPFNPVTTIRYELAEQGFVQLKVFDILGNEITDLVNEEKAAGSYSIQFDAENLPSGVYFYTLASNNYVQTRKMILMK